MTGKIVVARSREGNAEVQSRLSKLGIASVGVETIVFGEPTDRTAVDDAIKEMHDYDWVVFTSPRGVAAFAKRSKELAVKVNPTKPRMAAIGSKTADALAANGLRADFVPDVFLASALAEGIPSEFGKRVLLLRADIGEESLASDLEGRGFEVTDIAIYRTRHAPGVEKPGHLSNARIVIFASPSEVRGFKDRVDQEAFAAVASKSTAVCIGPVTAEAARAEGFRNVVSSEVHTVDGLVEKVREVATCA